MGNLKQIWGNIVNFKNPRLCGEITSFWFVFLQVSRLLGAFKNQKQVTRSFVSAVSIIVPSFSFKKFLKKGVQKFVRMPLLILHFQKMSLYALNATPHFYWLITAFGNCILK